MSTMRFYNEACNVLVDQMSTTELSLDVIRKKVFFHNSIDVWISACEEKNIEWFDIEQYKKFISYLLKNNLHLKAFNLCAHEAGATAVSYTHLTLPTILVV